MEKLYSCRKCSLISLFVLLVILSTEAVSKVQLNSDDGTYLAFDYKKSLVLQCNVTADGTETPTVKWQRNGEDVVGERVKFENQGNVHTLTISYATDGDAGNYTCEAGDARGEVTAVLKPYVKLQPHTSVVEGEKLTITCTVFGVPVPNIMWSIGNTTYNDSLDRVRLLRGKEGVVNKTVLQIEDATMSDRETYTCIAETRVGSAVYNHSSETFVRVKDKMAALWPFLGICIEVIVLCTVILVYEKKRNKTEMEESDTDGSPEQKNTPDHGKDSEVRHRK